MSLLTPKSWKHRKEHIKPIQGKAARGTSVSFGEYGLKATSSDYISNRQIEAARKVIARYIKKVGKVWIRVFPRVPLTKKGLEMPMGKGKGDVDVYTARIKQGKILFELSGLDADAAKEVLTKAGKKLSVQTRVVKRGEIR
jgi:large subunit ribosomal protein L16